MNKNPSSSSSVLFEGILLAVEVLASAGKVSLASARRLVAVAGRFIGYSVLGALMLGGLFALGIATGTAWLAIGAFFLLGVTTATYALFVAALIRAGDALLPDGLEPSTLLRGGSKLVEWFLLALFSLAVALYLLPAASWLTGLLFLGFMGLTYAIERRGPDPRWLRFKVICMLGLPLLAAAFTHIAEVKMPAATQSLKKSAATLDTTIANWVNDTMRTPQRVPVDTLAQFDATAFFDQDGNPRRWIYQPAEGPCELYATPGAHPYHRTVLAPATPALRDACRAALKAELQKQESAAQDEIRRKEQEAAERLRQETQAAAQQRQRQAAAEAERQQLQQQAAAERQRQQAIDAAERYEQEKSAERQRLTQASVAGESGDRLVANASNTPSSKPTEEGSVALHVGIPNTGETEFVRHLRRQLLHRYAAVPLRPVSFPFRFYSSGDFLAASNGDFRPLHEMVAQLRPRGVLLVRPEHQSCMNTAADPRRQRAKCLAGFSYILFNSTGSVVATDRLRDAVTTEAGPNEAMQQLVEQMIEKLSPVLSRL